VAIVAAFTYIVIRLQVSILYLNAGIAKLKVDEWVNGTALYYWFQNPVVGLDTFLKPIVLNLFESPLIVSLCTWMVIGFEIFLSSALVMPKRYWKALLVMGLSFHFIIAIFHGLISFGFAMSAALVLYLRPSRNEFHFSSIASNVVTPVANWFRAARLAKGKS
jgi:antimicrobial peptide system SdpB family protein